MIYKVPRTCRIESEAESGAKNKSIGDLRDVSAYVLLADPGAGKTVLFTDEAKAVGGVYLTARNFLTFNKDNEWQGKTLFIDGLDETRAGKDDVRTPLDAIRSKLSNLKITHFRLSCREADWLGRTDKTALDACSSDGKVMVLHLNPLSDENIREILNQDERIANVDEFMRNASINSLEGMLRNPQSLDMLISAVSGDNWPTTKLKTYELATSKLVQEQNDEHKIANNKKAPSAENLLDAASFLCAVQLLSNASEFNTNDDAGDGQVYLTTLPNPEKLPCYDALKTRLFTSLGDGRFQPIHRSVAEYLGARYLNKRLNDSLPLRRVLALTTGFDGGIVAALRGLMAWLSAFSTKARDHLIDIDPLGTVLYGDAEAFSTDAKKRILSALREEANKNGFLRYDYFNTYPFATLTTKDMSVQLLFLLNSPLREKPEQIVLNCILSGLIDSEINPELNDSLLAIVRDDTYSEDVRIRALQAFIHHDADNVAALMSLAMGLRDNKIKDRSNRLLGFLLPQLFPKHIKAEEILTYFKHPSNSQDISSHNMFWNSEFVKLIQKNDIPILLDELVEKGSGFLQLTQYSNLFEEAGQILVEGLSVFGSTIENNRLYNWLSIGLDKYAHSDLDPELKNKIKAWVESNSEHYFSILTEGLLRISGAEKFDQEFYGVNARLYSADPPSTCGMWWLEQAVLAKENKFRVAFFAKAFSALLNEKGHQGLSLEYFDAWVVQHPDFLAQYQNLCFDPIDDMRKEQAKVTKKWADRNDAEKRARHKYFSDQLSAIEDGTAFPQVFNHLAGAYFDHYSGIEGKTGKERLRALLCDDKKLIDATEKGLRKIIDREDLPQTSEIFALATKHQQHFIRLPYLTSLTERYGEDAAILDKLSDDQAGKALAFWYTYGAGDEPTWVKPLSLARPKLTAQVIVDYASTMLAAKERHIQALYQLAHDSDFHEIAKIAIIPLLNAYPIRSGKEQVSILESLLKTAIQTIEKQKLLELISERLTSKKLDVAQKVYWLCTGLVLEPSQYELKVRKYVNGKVTHINHLFNFFYDGLGTRQIDFKLQPSTIALIVELLAPRCTPYWPERTSALVTNTMNEGDYVRGLINRLAENPEPKIQQVILNLMALPHMEAWTDYLKVTRQTQSVSSREAYFRYPNANDAAQTLNNLNPANVADLAALTIEHLNDLSGEIRISNVDSYKQFWNVDAYGRLEKPRPENSCRDYLIGKLQPTFSKIGVDVQPETHEANDKRADMRLSFHVNGRAYHLPVEIKLSHSNDLWRAIHTQLIPSYTLDPKTQGRGLLLVVWFGSKEMPGPPSGKKPQDAIELQAKLAASLSPQEEKFIDIFVLDVSGNFTK